MSDTPRTDEVLIRWAGDPTCGDAQHAMIAHANTLERESAALRSTQPRVWTAADIHEAPEGATPRCYRKSSRTGWHGGFYTLEEVKAWILSGYKKRQAFGPCPTPPADGGGQP